MKNSKFSYAAGACAALALWLVPAQADEAKPLKVLTIGNSFSVQMVKSLPPVAKSLGRSVDICSLYIGGCSLERHVKNARTSAQTYSVTWSYADGKAPFVRDGKPLASGARGSLNEFIVADRWDVVTIQQASHFSWRPETFVPWGAELVAFIRKNAPQAKIVVHETWSYTPFDGRLAKWGITPDEMYARLYTTYHDFAAAYGFTVIPTGTAVQRFRQDLPVRCAENSFGGDPCGSGAFVRDAATGAWKPKGDVFHMNGTGNYLQALVWAETLFGADARACTYAPACVKADVAGKMRAAAHAACAAETSGFVDLFDGKTLKGWKLNGGSAEYHVENGTIAGVGVPGTPGNTFLCTEKEYENFIFRAEFKCESGNSGVQFRSTTRPSKTFRHGTQVFGYQSEITPDGGSVARVYDEGRRGHRFGIVWLDNTPQERQDAMRKTFKRQGWNTVEIQCVGPSIKTFVNGVKVTDILDDCQQKGFFGLQIHAQAAKNKDGTPSKPGRAWWRNVQIRELPPCPPWKRFFVAGDDGRMKVDGAHYVIPQDWKFVSEKGETYLRGVHDEKEKKDGLVVSDRDYGNFMARVTYKLNGGNSALYFRAAEEDIPWVLKGFQNEIAGNCKDSALWHTQGKTTKGRGWVASNDELVKKVRNAKGGWNTVSTIAVGDRIVNRINGFETFDIVDPLCEKTGRLGLQLHGGCKNEVRFRDWEVMPVEDWMLPYIAR